MAINYTTPSGTGTLSPPDLLDIENIYAPTAGNLELIADNSITLSPQGDLTGGGANINLTSTQTMNLNTDTELNLNSSGDTVIQGLNTFIQGTDSISVNSPLGIFVAVANNVSFQGTTGVSFQAPSILFNGNIYFQGQTTAAILAIVSPYLGTIVFNSTLNQLFYYQVSPITGLVLGWYNSTGNIKL
jgi:hypothetical protein